MKKVISLTLCLCICLLFFTSCGLSEDEKGADIRMYIADFPQTLDPALVQANSDVSVLLSLLFEPLTRIKENGKVTGALADDWYAKYDPVYEEYAIYFELNETLWSNGNAVTADNIVWAWKRILSPDTESPYAPLLYCIKNAKTVKSGYMTSDDLGITAEDDHLLKVVFEDGADLTDEEKELYGVSAYVYDDATFEAACDRFVETVSNVHLAPINEDVVKRYTDYRPEGSSRVYQWGDYSAASIVGNGPFKVQAFEPGNKLILERNSYYRYEEEMAIDKHVNPYRLSIYYYEGQVGNTTDVEGLTQEQYQEQRYKDGDIFYLGRFSKESYQTYSKKMETASTTNGYAYLFNTETISDANVRSALSAALDRNAIVKDITGTGEIAATGYVPSRVFNTDRKTDFRSVGGNLYADYTMDKAKELLGNARGNYRLIYLIPDDYSLYTNATYVRNAVVNYNVYEDIANYAVERWNELGVRVQAVGLVYDDYIKALQEGDFDIIGYNVMMDSTDAFSYLAPYAPMYSGRTVSINLEGVAYTPGYTKLNDADFNSLIDRAAYTADSTKRAEVLHEVEAKFTELCPATMLFYYTNSYVSSKMGGIGDADYFGCFPFTDASLSGWRKINAKESEAAQAAENNE